MNVEGFRLILCVYYWE